MASTKTNRYRLLVILLFFPLIMMSQDVVTLKDGSNLSCKVIEVGDNQIIFKQAGSNESMTLSVKDIESITYANGEKETFGKQKKEEKKEEQKQQNTVGKTDYTSVTETEVKSINQVDKNRSDWGFWELFYCSSFKKEDRGIWGLGGRIPIEWAAPGFGTDIQASTNLFLKRKGEIFGMNFAFGIDYTLMLTNDGNVCLMLPLMACCSAYEEYDEYGEKTDKLKKTFGVTSTPSLLLGKFIRLGYQVTYMNKNWSKSFFVGITL